MKRIFKRALPLLLALVLVLTMAPGLAVEADAATTKDFSGSSVDGLGFSATDPTNATGNQAAAECKWTANGTTLTGSLVGAKAKGDGALWQGYYYQSESTLTLTNNKAKTAELSFKYTVTSQGSKYGDVTVNGTTHTSSVNTAQNVKVTLASGGSITIKLHVPQRSQPFSMPTANGASITITDLALTVDDSVTVNFGTASNGSYTVKKADGTQVNTSTALTARSTDRFNLTATPSEGYAFSGWYYTLEDGTETFFSGVQNATDRLFDKNGTLVPKFISTADGTWGVGEAKFDALDKALLAAELGSTKEVILLKDTTVSGSYTIPGGVTVLIPYDDANTISREKPAFEEIPDGTSTPTCAVYRKLTLAPRARITVNGELELGAKHYASHGGRVIGGTPITGYGQIEMGSESAITVNGGGKLFAWGYITGSGTVTAESGAKIYEKMQVSDYRGGNITSQIVCCGVFPFNQYYIQNVEVRETLKAGATLICHAAIYGNGLEESTVDFMGGASAMFNLSSGTVTKYYDTSTDRLMIDVNGSVSMNSISIMGYDTSSYILPLNHNITVNFKDGAAGTLNQDMMFQPGATINVDDGATLTLASGKKVYLMDSENWGNYCFGVPLSPISYLPSLGKAPTIRTAANMTDAIVNVNGSLIVNGQMYATAAGAQIVSNEETGSIHFVTACPTDQPTLYQSHVVEKQYNPLAAAHGVFHNQTNNKNLTAFTVYPAVLRNGDDTTVTTSGVDAETVYKYCAMCDKWFDGATEVTVTFDANGGTGTMDALITHTDCSVATITNAFTAPEGMKFKQWNTVKEPTEETPGTVCEDGTKISETNIAANVTDGKVTLYAQWEADAIAVVVKGTIPYTVQGQVVTVTHTAACKVGYGDATNSKYGAITATPNDDGSYSFTAPEGVTEVLLVAKGDVNADGKYTAADTGSLNGHVLGKRALSVEMQFAGDINGDGKFTAADTGSLNGHVLGKRALTWG